MKPDENKKIGKYNGDKDQYSLLPGAAPGQVLEPNK
jgi:hypothetical protein